MHLKGRGDFLAVFVIDLAPGASTEPQQHLYEEVIYVLEGHGSTTFETHDGETHSFEWGPRSLFALPLNARHQHFNGSGSKRARLSSTNNLPLVMNLFHNHDFVFSNPFPFPEREGQESYFAGEGEFIPKEQGRHMWETNFVPDMSMFELRKWVKRGAGGSNMMFVLAEKRAVFMGMDVNVHDGGAQIEYEDQDPRIHEIYLESLAKAEFLEGALRREMLGYPVFNVADIATDPQLDARGYWQDLPAAGGGRERHGGGFAIVDGERLPLRLAVPGPGEHSRQVLSEFGFSEPEIDDLVSAGAVGVE